MGAGAPNACSKAAVDCGVDKFRDKEVDRRHGVWAWSGDGADPSSRAVVQYATEQSEVACAAARRRKATRHQRDIIRRIRVESSAVGWTARDRSVL